MPGVNLPEVTSTERAAYGDRYAEDFIRQYELAVTMADQVSGRRERMNAFFVTAAATLASVYAVSVEFLSTDLPAVLRAVVPFVGIVVCVLWFLLVNSYRTLNKAKWAVVGEMEKHLPARPFCAEYECTKRLRHLPFTKVERWVPVALGALFIAVVVGELWFR